jgi:hypothetical protein
MQPGQTEKHHELQKIVHAQEALVQSPALSNRRVAKMEFCPVQQTLTP